MKKRVFALAACLLLVMVTTTQVAIARTPQALPILSFSGTTARGSVICQADGDLERISAKLTLYEGNIYSGSGTGMVPVSGECTVKSGKTYRLVLTWSINGVAQPSESITRKCP